MNKDKLSLTFDAVIPHLKGSYISNGEYARVVLEIDLAQWPDTVALAVAQGKTLNVSLEEAEDGAEVFI